MEQRALDHLADECRCGRVRRARTVGWTILTLLSTRCIKRYARKRQKSFSLRFTEGDFSDLREWTEVEPGATDCERAVGALARIAFDPLDTAQERLDELAASLSRRPFAWSAEGGMTDPVAAVFVGYSLYFAESRLRRPWQRATRVNLDARREAGEAEEALRGSWSPDSRTGSGGSRARLTALCSLIEGYCSGPCYSRPFIKNVR